MKRPLLIGLGCLGLLFLCCCASSAVFYSTNAIIFDNIVDNTNEAEDLDDQLDELNRIFEDEFGEDFLEDEFSELDEIEDTIEETVEEELGVIQGSLSFPSEGIPPLEICAVNIISGNSFCTRDIVEDASFTYSKGYRINVPSGTYTVYASQIAADDGVEEYKAYYSEFVKCGLDISCPSHAPINVVVVSGEVVDGIDPADWYSE